MQKKINQVKDSVSEKLSKLGIPFEITESEIENDSNTEKFVAYNFITENVCGCVMPNFNSRKPEFLVLNQNMIEHLESEGLSEEEITENGKIWLHFSRLENFVDCFTIAVK